MGKAPANLLKLLGRIKFRRRNLIAFAYAFGAALTFWVFNALGNRFDTYLEYPIEIQYDKGVYISTSRVPSSVAVSVNGTGWSILRHQFERHPPLVIEVNDSLLQSQPLYWDIFLPLIRQRFNNLNVSEFLSRTTTLPIEPLMLKKVWVVAVHTEIDLNVECLPSIVEVSGPAGKVRAFADTIRLKVTESNPSLGYAEKIRLKNDVYEGLTLKPSQVIVSFNALKTDSVAQNAEVPYSP